LREADGTACLWPGAAKRPRLRSSDTCDAWNRLVKVADDDSGDSAAWLTAGDEGPAAGIRRRTRTGRPCGGEEFVRKPPSLLGRPLLPAKRGRKPGARPKEQKWVLRPLFPLASVDSVLGRLKENRASKRGTDRGVEAA